MLDPSIGVVSYAGLNRQALLEAAKAAFMMAETPVPPRFESFLPLFPAELVVDMDYRGARASRTAPSGFSIDPAEYHRKLSERLPELYIEDNRRRNFDYEGRYTGQRAFTVDQAWVERFPQYQPFVGEPLFVRLIGGGAQAVAVPLSVYPRGCGVLDRIERDMGVTERAGQFARYAATRVAAGEEYVPEAFARAYISDARLEPVLFTQNELGHILQDLSIVRGLGTVGARVGLYTDNAKRAEGLRQYVPSRYACDTFEREPVGQRGARLAQLCYADADFVSDLWIPYQEIAEYIDRAAMTLDVAALCAAYQIAPDYDPETGGGRYPDTLRVVIVRDRELNALTAETLNNPAYGDGTNRQGMLCRHVLLRDSRELLRQHRLAPEETLLRCVNLTLPPDPYRQCLAAAVLQEHKGRLVDAMYRREAALSQIPTDAPIYARARTLLDQRVSRLERLVERESAQTGFTQMSGYDADVDYLRRKRIDRECADDPLGGTIAFAEDALRERSIESGYAMRSGVVRADELDARLPGLPDDAEVEPDEPEAPSASATLQDAPEASAEDAPREASEPAPSGVPAKPPTAPKEPFKPPVRQQHGKPAHKKRKR